MQIPVCLADISWWMAVHWLKLNPCKTDLLYIPDSASPFWDLVISLGLTFWQFSKPCCIAYASSYHFLLIFNSVAGFSITISGWQWFISVHWGHSSACSVSCHLEIGLLQLVLARLPPHSTLTTGPRGFHLTKFSPITSLLYSLYSLSTSDLNHQCLPTKAKMNQIPPYCRHISNPVLHHITTFPSSCIQAWLKLIHHPSRHQKNRHQDSSLYWHQHNGKNISWFSEHLNHRFS